MYLKRFHVEVVVSGFCLLLAVAPTFVSAHEVYVLRTGDIQKAMMGPAMPVMQVILDNLHQFIFWAFLCFVVITTIFFMSISRYAERMLNPFFRRVKSYAPLLVRMSVGASMLASAYNQALFGPELPFTALFGAYTPIATAAIVSSGSLLIARSWTRVAMLVVILTFAAGVYATGSYMLTYAEYLDAFAMMFLLEAASQKSTSGILGTFISRSGQAIKPYRFAILRILFGIALVYASVYAKLLHPTLTLMVIEQYHLTSYWLFGAFEPHFLVLGAAFIELLCGIFFIVGFEIRHTSLFVLFWLTLSLLFFGESVWPHIIIFGLAGAFFLYGYDRYSLEGRYFKRGDREPVL